MQRAAPSVVSVVVIVSGVLFFYFDSLYGPRDEVLYLWPLPVLLLMSIAACVLLYQVGMLILAPTAGSRSVVRKKPAKAPSAD